MNKHRECVIGGCILAGLLLAGCGGTKIPEVVDTTSIEITDEGAVTSYLVDVFDKDYYVLSELKDMVIEEAAQYNTEHQTGEQVPVTVEKVENSGSKVIVVQKYDSADTFADYNANDLFYGTVEEALRKGYSPDGDLKSVKDGSLLSGDMLTENLKRHILITDYKAKLYCPDKVTHISENAVYCDDGSVDGLAAEGTIVVLMK